MWKLTTIGLAMFIVGSCSWRLGENLSSDAIGMALGIMFGVLAGLPVALLVLASDRRQAERNRFQPPRHRVEAYSQVEGIGQKRSVKLSHHFLTCEYCGQPFKLVGGTWRHRCTVMFGGDQVEVIDVE